MATEGQKTTVTKISKPNGWISHNEWDRRNNYQIGRQNRNYLT